MKKLFAIACMAMLCSCASTDSSTSNNVNQDEIWQSYWVEYIESSETITAGCTFRFGGSTGTTLQLTEPSKVLFEGNEMDFTNSVLIKGIIGGTHYNYEGKGALNTKYTFEYTNNNGKLFTNSISTSAIEIEAVPEELSVTADNIITLKKPLGASESLSVKVSNETGNFKTFDEYKSGQNQLTIPGSELNELGNGPVTITFTKRKEVDALQQANHLGGGISFTFESKGYLSKLTNAGAKPVDNKQADTITTNSNK